MSREKESLRLRLTYPLPPEAIKPHPSKNGMSSINAIYVTERLNQVFGIGGWSFESDPVNSTAFTQTTKSGSREMFRGVVKCRLSAGGGMYETTASSDNNDEGDALKGAATDGLTKLASWLGIGAHVWKNQTHEQAMAAWQAEWDAFSQKYAAPAVTDAQLSEVFDLCVHKGIDSKTATAIEAALRSGKRTFEATVKYLNDL